MVGVPGGVGIDGIGRMWGTNGTLGGWCGGINGGGGTTIISG